MKSEMHVYLSKQQLKRLKEGDSADLWPWSEDAQDALEKTASAKNTVMATLIYEELDSVKTP